MTETNETKIAVLHTVIENVKEQTKLLHDGLREQNKAQYDSLAGHISSVQGDLIKVQQDVKLLIETMNKGKGAYTASLLLAGILGSAALTVIQWASGLIKH